MWGIHILGIQGALPIEQLFLNAQIGHAISKSLHMVIAGDCTYEYVPDQISGIFFGWAKPEAGGVSRSVISIGWDFSLRTVERVMVCILDLGGLKISS
jgi:hypothetical protein